MKTEKIHWNVRRTDADHLSKSLKPIRSYEEVAVLLGVSGTVVRHLETSALRKIMRAVTRPAPREKHQP